MIQVDPHPYSIPYLRTLGDRLRAQCSKRIATASGAAFGFHKWRALYGDLELLPYCLAGTFRALERLASAQERMGEALIANGRLSRGSVLLLHAHERDEIAFALDEFLNWARRAQNAMTRYIHRTLNKDVPRSMSDTIKLLRTGKLDLPDQLSKELQKYWEVSGLRLREYRVLSQHYAVIASDARAFLSEANLPIFYLAIPNNPGEKSPEALSYNNPRVFALEYAVLAYRDLYNIAFMVSVFLLAQTGSVEIGAWEYAFLPQDPPTSEPQSGYRLEAARVTAYAWDLRREYEQKAEVYAKTLTKGVAAERPNAGENPNEGDNPLGGR